MKYKSKHDLKYLLLLVIYMFMDTIRKNFSRPPMLFQVLDKIVPFILLGILLFEIGQRRKFDREQELPAVFITGSEIVCLIFVAAAVIMVLFFPIGR